MKRNSAKKKRERKAHRSYLELNLLHDHVFHSRAEVSRFEDDVLFSSHVEKHYYFGLLLLLLLLREEDRLWIAPHQFSLLRGWDKEVRRSSTKTLSSLSSPRDLPRRRRRLTPPLPLLRRGATLFRAGGALRRENSAAEK